MIKTTESFWPNSPGVIRDRKLQLGRVSLFSINPFPGSTLDWSAWIESMGTDRMQWSHRNGISPFGGQTNFYEFLVPGVGDVPIYSFLFIVTIFAIVIGPLNYWLLFRRKQQQYLLLTTPLIALITSAALFVYAAASDGFGVRSRTSSLTLLDHRSESAVTLQRHCIFAGLAPYDGLRFSNESAVFPILPPNALSGLFTVDSTQDQHLTNGWLPSRVMSQFVIVTRRKERTRVEVSRTSNGKDLQFSSSLPWKLRYLLLIDENGDEYYGENIRAGESVTLRIATSDDCKRMRDLAVSDQPAMPSEISDIWQNPGWRYNSPRYGEQFTTKSQHERLLGSLYTLQRPFVEPRHFMAILSERPGLEQGTASVPSVKDLNVLIGDY
jgi:hypothetical protein